MAMPVRWEFALHRVRCSKGIEVHGPSERIAPARAPRHDRRRHINRIETTDERR